MTRPGTPGPDSTAPAWAVARLRRRDSRHPTLTMLLDAAAEEFAAGGYARTSVAAIAARAGVSRAAFYAYFSSKDDVFRQVASAVRDDFLAAHDMVDADVRDPYALGRASTRAFLAAYAANGPLLAVIAERADADERIRALWTEMEQRPVRRMVRYVRALQAENRATPIAPPSLIAEALLGMYTRFGRTAPVDEPSFERLVDALTAIYLGLIGVDRPDAS